MYQHFIRSIAFLLLLLMPICVLAQDNQTAPQQPSQDQDQPLETLSVNVNVVNLYFNVKGKHNALIPGLNKDAFNILEDGKPQTIKYFSREVDQPLTLGMLIDTSPSQQQVLTIEQQVGAQFLEQVLRPKDLAFLINFDVNIELDQDLTNQARLLKKSLNELHINGGAGGVMPGMGGGPFPTTNQGATHLYDAIFLAADEKLKSEVGRKAMIVLTDGEDQGSRETIKEGIEEAQKADAICYVLLIADRGFYGGMYGGDAKMKELAEQTGGRVIEVGNDQKKLKEALDQISNELRTQYYIGYAPTNQKRDGSYRKVEVKMTNSDYKVQARKGYYAPNK